MNIASADRALDEVVQPLIQFLNDRYPAGGLEEFQFQLVDRYDDDHDPDRRAIIERPDVLAEHPSAARVIATILRATGSEAVWVSGHTDQNNRLGGPLRFSHAERVAWAGSFWVQDRLLVVDSDAEVDFEAAARQIADLIEYLGHEQNLIEFGPEELEIF